MRTLTALTSADIDNFRIIDEEGSPDLLNELIGGEIVVRGPMAGRACRIWAEISNQIMLRSAGRALVSARTGLATPHGFFIPDMTVVDQPGFWCGRPSWGPPDGIAMLLEITASYRDTDRVHKRLAYAAAGIPLYLLIDRNHRESVLFSQPDVEAQDYRADIRVPFGSDLELPAPFSFTLTDFAPMGPRPREL